MPTGVAVDGRFLYNYDFMVISYRVCLLVYNRRTMSVSFIAPSKMPQRQIVSFVLLFPSLNVVVHGRLTIQYWVFWF